MTCLCVKTLTQDERDKAQLVAMSLGYAWADSKFHDCLNKRNFSYLFLYSVSPGRTDDENKRNMITCSDSFHVNSGRTGEPVEIITLENLCQLPPLKKN